MAKSVKFKNNVYLDVSAITVNNSGDTLKSWMGDTRNGGFVTKYAENGTNLTITLPNSSRHLIVLSSGTADQYNNVLVAYVTGYGGVVYRPIATQHSNTPISLTTNTLTITNSSGSGLTAYVLTLAGNKAS